MTLGARSDPDRVTSVAVTPTGHVVAASSLDGTITSPRAARGRARVDPVAAKAPSNATIAVTPDGHVSFDGPDARQHVVCQMGSRTYSLDLCEERSVVPDLIASGSWPATRGTDREVAVLSDLAKAAPSRVRTAYGANEGAVFQCLAAAAIRKKRPIAPLERHPATSRWGPAPKRRGPATGVGGPSARPSCRKNVAVGTPAELLLGGCTKCHRSAGSTSINVGAQALLLVGTPSSRSGAPPRARELRVTDLL